MLRLFELSLHHRRRWLSVWSFFFWPKSRLHPHQPDTTYLQFLGFHCQQSLSLVDARLVQKKNPCNTHQPIWNFKIFMQQKLHFNFGMCASPFCFVRLKHWRKIQFLPQTSFHLCMSSFKIQTQTNAAIVCQSRSFVAACRNWGEIKWWHFNSPPPAWTSCDVLLWLLIQILFECCTALSCCSNTQTLRYNYIYETNIPRDMCQFLFNTHICWLVAVCRLWLVSAAEGGFDVACFLCKFVCWKFIQERRRCCCGCEGNLLIYD